MIVMQNKRIAAKALVAKSKELADKDATVATKLFYYVLNQLEKSTDSKAKTNEVHITSVNLNYPNIWIGVRDMNAGAFRSFGAKDIKEMRKAMEEVAREMYQAEQQQGMSK